MTEASLQSQCNAYLKLHGIEFYHPEKGRGLNPTHRGGRLAPIDGEWLPVSNAATYSLYRYCPHFGRVKNHNVVMKYATAWQGNQKFINIRKDFEERLNENY